MTRDCLAVHADRSSSLCFKPVSQLLVDLGFIHSHGRTPASNYNRYSKVQRETWEYSLTLSQRLRLIDETRSCCLDIFTRYHFEHCRSSIALHLLVTVHCGITTKYELSDKRLTPSTPPLNSIAMRLRNRIPLAPQFPDAPINQRANNDAARIFSIDRVSINVKNPAHLVRPRLH